MSGWYYFSYIILTLFLFGYFYFKYTKVKIAPSIKPEEIQENKLAYTRFIDVRSDKERNLGYIKGTEHWPYDQILNLSVEKKQNLILFCNSGIRSSKAAKDLLENGFDRVKYIDGHYQEILKYLG